ncbi:MAG TPA: T9SS type A sorting domain-containing protein [Saprospiraceae bacterium]|nr:T9SS type A sorting domain-containing protein [Saprospiraceae bacterium]HPI04733.1 T9SS type A sorting domain-containing protein [Saprospiraceae bacterium]
MKNLLLYPLLLIFSSTLFAQNWMPVVPGDLYHFRAVDSSFITHTIRVDSVKMTGLDSVFYLNRVIRTENPGQDLFAFANSLGQFLGQTITKKPDGRLILFSELHGTPLSVEIRPGAATGQNWLALADSNLTATVSSIEDGMVLGEPDSLKTIVFSNGATWILSKNHGLVQANDLFFSPDVVMLEGIETRSLGAKPLYFEDFFDFNVGDVFEWYASQEGFGIGNFNIDKCRILEKEVHPDYFNYLVDRKQKYSFGGGPSPSGIGYRADTLWIMFHRGAFPASDAYNNENLLLWFAERSTYAVSFEQGKRIGSRPSPTGAPMQCPVLPIGNNLSELYYSEGNNTCCNISTFECEEGKHYEEYRTGLGRVELIEGFIDGYNHDRLLGAVIQSDTVWGQISPDWFFTATQSPQNVQPLVITPNPAGDFIQFSTVEMEGQVQVTVSDLSGKVMLNTKLNANNSPQLNVSRLSPGIYFVQLLHENRVWTGKFQKVE